MMSAKEGVESSAASGDSGATATFMRPERDDERVHNENDDDEAVYRVRVPFLGHLFGATSASKALLKPSTCPNRLNLARIYLR
jgi:hypothetical protein